MPLLGPSTTTRTIRTYTYAICRIDPETGRTINKRNPAQVLSAFARAYEKRTGIVVPRRGGVARARGAAAPPAPTPARPWAAAAATVGAKTVGDRPPERRPRPRNEASNQASPRRTPGRAARYPGSARGRARDRADLARAAQRRSPARGPPLGARGRAGRRHPPRRRGLRPPSAPAPHPHRRLQPVGRNPVLDPAQDRDNAAYLRPRRDRRGFAGGASLAAAGAAPPPGPLRTTAIWAISAAGSGSGSRSSTGAAASGRPGADLVEFGPRRWRLSHAADQERRAAARRGGRPRWWCRSARPGRRAPAGPRRGPTGPARC